MNIKPSKHLVNILANTKEQLPSFTLFLGAGASVESGIESGGQLIEKWRDDYWERFGNDEEHEKDTFLESQPWHGDDDEYSVLFEKLYDTPSQRRNFIETVVGDKKPSWGYMYLVDLLRRQIFNTVFTTNFDDLLNEACYVFSSDVRPIVSAHDSSIHSIRLSSKRPKIIKLHGDFLFDSIKNTVRELESLESNTRDKFREFSNEFGMIVIGYSGSDRSIMDALDALLRDARSFPHGIYWCIRNENSVTEPLAQLARFPNFHMVQIDGFDSFLAELHEGVDIGTHPIVEQPFNVVTERLTSLLNGLPVRREIPDVLKTDIRTLARHITSTPRFNLPYTLLARVEFEAGNSREGLEHLLAAIENNPGRSEIFQFCTALIGNWDKETVDTFMDTVTERSIRLDGINDLALKLIKAKRYKIAEFLISRDLQFKRSSPDYHLLNLMQLKIHQKQKLSEEEESAIKNILERNPKSLAAYGANCVLGNFDEAVELVSTNSTDGNVFGALLSDLLEWPITDLLPEKSKTKIEQIDNE